MRFYIVDVYSGDAFRTDSETTALNFAEVEEQYVVIDTTIDKVIFCDGNADEIEEVND